MRNSAACAVAAILAGRAGVQFSVEVTDFSVFRNVQTGSGDKQCPYNGYSDTFPED